MTKVLYVEHNDDNLYMLKTRLELLGDFEVLAAGGQREGLQAGRDRAPRRNSDGPRNAGLSPLEAVRRLKKIRRPATSRSSACLRYALDSEREKAIATGCDEFDAKPIEFE